MSVKIELQQSLPRPETIRHVDKITFNHPGYSFPYGVLLVLPRLGKLLYAYSSDGPKTGVHHGTALAACRIIANNAVNGYFTTDREGRERVNLSLLTLSESEYWFFAGPEPGDKYPVVPSFRDWEFPHGSPIVNWPRTGTWIDGRCIATHTAELVKTTHLIPTTDEEWFRKNGMHRYVGGTGCDIDKPGNQITLRSDMCHAFEAGWFTMVPSTSGNVYIIHLFETPTTGTKEFAAMYSNRCVEPPKTVAPELLFASFARAVLTRAESPER